ncbi:hypothetical protein F2Q70_00014824 [Brassica cretica]|uniref:Uncharacterized protein n=1 Tax=Brassica cretica TaxID=69181 RepID=A0A8S9HQQ7_BRACR|nr:hypothetical protein F2Q70_00014824 [Brassica cretica]
MDRGNNMNRAKRSFDGNGDGDQPDRKRPALARSVVGWLKIKAAMRWGFFIRRKAAERRAQIVELDDDDEE